MAIPTSFKQQCPSCEAMVPIRDPKLIGRKIDCPKCKYRFVVEEPVDDVEEVEDEAPAKKGKGGTTAITKQKSAVGKPAKVPTKRRADDDQDIETKPKKKQGGSGMLIVGIALAAVAVIALAVGAVFLFSGDSGDDKPSTRPSPATAQRPDDSGEVKKPEKPAEPEKPKLRQEDITNLLPNDTQVVLNLPLEHLLGNDKVNQALLITPGTFNPAAFQRTWGIAPNFVRRVVIAANAEKKSVFSVMRTTVPLKENKITEELKLKAEAPINGLKYYLVKKPLDALSTFLLKCNMYHDKVALHFMDPYTVVCADGPVMNQFLLEKGQPRQLSKKVAEEEPKNEPEQGGRPGGPPGGMQGGPPMGMQGGPPGGMQGGPPGGMRGGMGRGPGGPGGGPGGFQPPANMPGGMAPPGMAGEGAAGVAEAAPVSSSYMTVDPQLKAVLDQAEKADKTENQNVLLSFALSTSAISAEDLKKGLAQAQAQQGNVPQISDFALKLGLDYVKGHLKAVAVGVTEFNESRVVGNVAAAAKDAALAQEWQKKADEFIPTFLTATGLDFASRNAGRNMQGMGGMMGGMQGMQGGPPGGMQGGPPPGMLDRMRGGMGMQGGPPAGFQGGPPPGFQGPQAPQGEGQEKKEATGKQGNYGMWLKDNVLALGITYNIPSEKYQLAAQELEIAGIYLRGTASMSDRQSHIHELAAAMQAYFEEKGRFPRGAYRTGHDSLRFLEWRPDQRLSWMKELLPYLANGEFRGLSPKDDKAWYEGLENVKAGMTVIPQFVAPMKSETDLSFYVTYPNLPVKTSTMWAATHFVGMAGVGLDAAEYRADDAATAKLRGVFGYDRETKKGDIKDGLAQTIVLIQVPPEPKSPWIAGGGSTVRGVSEDLDCVQPFVSTDYQGKRGTFAIMADGKVRFIPANIDPKTFQALCTIAGGEKIRDLDKIAPEVPPPEDQPQAELKAEEPARAVPPPVQGAKEEQGQDLKKLQGTWTLVSGEVQGKAVPAEVVKQLAGRLIVTGDKYDLKTTKEKEAGVLKLDETKTPKAVDAQISEGKDKGKTQLGIYSLSGDELKLSFALPGQPRPAGFTTQSGSTNQVFVFKREKP